MLCNTVAPSTDKSTPSPCKTERAASKVAEKTRAKQYRCSPASDAPSERPAPRDHPLPVGVEASAVEFEVNDKASIDAGSIGDNTDMTSIVEDLEPSSSRASTHGSLDNDDEGYDDEDYDDDGLASLYSLSRFGRGVPAHFRSYETDRSTINSSARSLYDGDVYYTMEHGRRYCGSYYMPNDDSEQDRMRILHQVFMLLGTMELTTVPLDDPTMILDIGTGTGEWAVGMAERYPECEIIGTDISAIQPTSVPYKVFFELDDAEVDWMRPTDAMDLVHLRAMSGAFSDWGFIYRQAYQCLKPGGYVEIIDFHDETGCAGLKRHFSPDSPVHALLAALDEADGLSGRARGCGHMDPDMLSACGFVDVKLRDYSVCASLAQQPLASGGAASPPSALGKFWLVACLFSLEAVTLRLLTKYAGWSAERVVEACEEICGELKALACAPDTGADFRIRYRVATARKPSAAGTG